jgi:hypothetical protein
LAMAHELSLCFYFVLHWFFRLYSSEFIPALIYSYSFTWYPCQFTLPLILMSLPWTYLLINLPASAEEVWTLILLMT